jgi:hypothetical protein
LSTAAAATLLMAAGILGAVPVTAAAATPRTTTTAGLAKPRVPAGVYLGAVPDMAAGVGTPQQAATFTAETGRPPAIVSYYLGWTSPLPTGLAGLENDDAIPMISWGCGPSDANVAAGKDDATIKAMAGALKAYGRPVLLRWFWEMNYKNLHTNCLGTTNTAATYGKAWVHIWQLFQSMGAVNVAFVWAPSAARFAPSATAFWPGTTAGCPTQDGCVDWIGADLYDRTGYADDFAKYYGAFYSVYSTGYGNKPLILSETGATPETSPTAQQNWLGNIAKSARSQFPHLHAIVYFDGNGQLGAAGNFDYILRPGTAGMAAWKALAAAPGMQEYLGPIDAYGFATAAGTVHVYGSYNFGSVTGQQLPGKIVGFAFGPHASGYWLTGADGSVYALGSVPYLGSMRGMHLNKPIVAMAATPDGRGYWLVASDGGIFNYGDAHFYGSAGNIRLHRPIVGMASTGDGHGYWLVASDGGMFAYGDAKFRGSMGGKPLNKPIDGMASTGDGGGYWLVAADGGIFTFGDAHFGGSLGGDHLAAPVSSAARDLLNGYYVVLTQAGTVYQFPGGTLASTASETSPAVQIATCPIG